MTDSELVHVGTVRRPHGVRGEVTATVSPDQIEWFAGCPDVVLDVGGTHQDASLEAIRGVPDKAILAFAECSNRDDAERLRGARILARRRELAAIDPDAVLHDDLLGLPVEDPQGTAIGSIEAIMAYPSGDVLDMRAATDGRQGLMLFRAVTIRRDGRRPVAVQVAADDIAWQ